MIVGEHITNAPIASPTPPLRNFLHTASTSSKQLVSRERFFEQSYLIHGSMDVKGSRQWLEKL